MLDARMQLSPAAAGRRRQAGYSLPELLIATALSLVAIGAVLSFNRAQLFALRNQSTQLDVQTVGRNFIDLFTREVRRAGMDPTCAKSFEGIADARPNRIQVKADLNKNGAVDVAGEDVTYTYDPDSGSVTRATGGSTESLLSNLNVAGSTLRYYDGAGVELVPAGNPAALTVAQRTAARRVQLVLVLQAAGVDPRNPAPFKASFSTNVDLRNRFFVTSTACP